MAAYEGLKSGYGNVIIIKSSGGNFVSAGRLRLVFSDPVKNAEYVAEVESLVRGDLIKCGSYQNPDFYVLTVKGLSTAKDIFDKGDGESTLADLRNKLQQD